MKQGDVAWADLPEPAGRRPVLVLTRSAALTKLNNVTIAPLTRSIRPIATQVILDPKRDRVPTACAVSLDNLTTIPRDLLDQPIARLSAARMSEVFAAIRAAFAMPDDG